MSLKSNLRKLYSNQREERRMMSGSGKLDSQNVMNTTNTTDCFQFDHEKELATVAIVCAAISLVASLVVMVLVCGLKKCHVLSQRLILYLAVAAIIKCLSWGQVVANYDFLPNSHSLVSGSTDTRCAVAGYFMSVAGWFEAMAVACLSTNLLLNMVLTKSQKWLELVYVVLIFVLPFSLMWIPFVTRAYGRIGFYCWIRAMTNSDNCGLFRVGIGLQFLLWYAPLALALVHLLALYFRVMWITSKQRTRWDGNSNPTTHRNKLKTKDVRQLIWYPLIYFLLYLVPLGAQVSLVLFSRPVYSLWFLSAITQPLQGGFAAVAFALDTQTVRRLRRQNLTATVRGITHSVIVEDYPTEHALEDQTYEQSREQSQRSSSTSSSSDDGEGDNNDGGPRPRRGRYTEFSL